MKAKIGKRLIRGIYFFASGFIIFSSTGCSKAVMGKVPTGNVHGKVIDQNSGSALNDVKVVEKPESKETYTDKKGNYKFHSLEANKTHTLKMTKALYRDGGTSVFVEPNKDTEASTVELVYEGKNIKWIAELKRLFEDKKYDEFGEKLSSIHQLCEDIETRNCQLIREIKALFDEEKFEEIPAKLEELSAEK